MFNEEKKIYVKPYALSEIKYILFNPEVELYTKIYCLYNSSDIKKIEKVKQYDPYVRVTNNDIYLRELWVFYNLICNYNKLDEKEKVKELLDVFNKFIDIEHKDEISRGYAHVCRANDINDSTLCICTEKNVYTVENHMSYELRISIYNLLRTTERKLRNLADINNIKKKMEREEKDRKEEAKLEFIVNK